MTSAAVPADVAAEWAELLELGTRTSNKREVKKQRQDEETFLQSCHSEEELRRWRDERKRDRKSVV